MGGKGGGGGANQMYQQEFTGPGYEKTSPEMDARAAQLRKMEQDASDAWARGERPKDVVPAKAKESTAKAIELPAPNAGAPKPVNWADLTVQTDQAGAGAGLGLGDVMVAGLSNRNLTGQV